MWGCGDGSSREETGKQQQKPERSLLQGDTPETHPSSPTASKAVQDAPGFWEIVGSETERLPRGQTHPAPLEPTELHASAVLAEKLQAMRGRNKSKTKHLSKYPFPVACTVMQFFQSHGLCGSGGQFHALTPA